MLLINFVSLAQNPTSAFGKVDMADLQLKECDFEKDANAMVLFDKGDVYFDQDFTIIMERHKRIKIFNDKGKDAANIRIPYYGGNRAEYITDIQVETINDNNGKPEITKLERKLIYTETIDKFRNAIVFAFPNVKAGSIIEYKYRYQNLATLHLPDWYFQSYIPVKYSEIATEIPEELYYRNQTRVHQQYIKNTSESLSRTLGGGATARPTNFEKQIHALNNIPSLQDEPYMSSRNDNLQSILFHLTTIKPIGGFVRSVDTWAKIGGIVIDDEDFGGQLKRKLKGEEAIIEKAKTLKSDDEKIAYVFNEVKNRMKWNDDDEWYTNDGTVKAWEKQSGSSAEINLALFHLLKQIGLNAYPMILSTRDHGKVNYAYPFLYQFNRAVAYIPVDSAKYYILDATNKYNVYNETPSELLNSYGLFIDKGKKIYNLLFIEKKEPARQVIMVNAEIKPDSKMIGTAVINNTSYYKIQNVKLYKKDGEEKYKNHLKDDDNNITISSLKMENMDVDSLPLTQKLDFQLTLTGSDGGYIYFSPNLFTSLRSNPLLNETRATDIDFSYRSNYSINGAFKIPLGFKTEALPKSITLMMPDKSISFKRLVGEEDGVIHVSYMIKYNKVIYFKEDYPQLHEFYKKMHEMLNEQIVLKKA